ncbi:hypothetical protein B0T16DRAFT_363413 [Cercophora newfieldiana]|uniref:Zn(2)-C6 fungal-type domain-containing protein n=1 Tax=Cercophora newfieldiana TaxID=92897 RepID=A0AA39YV51_9PEZI|nr:hypothetical protein B0T16DRAFT_363413 [Cercophora newfieldiana]
MATSLLATKACTACAKAKRRCGRQTPECIRCATRGLTCAYPPSRPTCWVQISTPSPCDPDGTPGSQPLLTNTTTTTTQTLPLPSPLITSFLPQLTLSDLQQAWFLTPNTWSIHRIPPEDLAPVSSLHISIRRGIAHFQTLVSSWILSGSSPFIHARLYEQRMPRCVGDAFTTLTTYMFTKGAIWEGGARELALRVVGEKIVQTVEEESEREGVQMERKGRLDVFSHVARVHALMMLVVIGLFDGDIRLRHIAETHLPTLVSWNYAMLEAAKMAARSGELLMGNWLDHNTGDGQCDSGSAARKSGVDSLWQAFILSETIRRTWVVCSTAYGGYRLLQSGQLHCCGGLMFTTAEGVWDAPSAWAWAKMCAEKDVGFMEQAQTKRLFGERRPDEIDTFGKLVLTATYGPERMESWGVPVNA